MRRRTALPASLAASALAFGIAATAAGRQPAADPLPRGEGRAAVVTMCGESTCHGVRSALAKRRTRLDWQSVIDDMREKGAPGSDEDARAALGYLVKVFGLVNVNKAPADDLRDVLDLSPEQARAIVAYREAHGDFAGLADLMKVDGLDAKTVDGKRDAIVFSDR